MNNKNYLLGIDIGSSGCKASLFNVDTKKSTTVSEEITTFYPHPGWSEQDPEEWVSKVSLLIKKVMEKESCRGENISAVGLSGVTHSLLMLDKNRKPLGRTIHITDGRSFRQTEKIREKAGELILERALNSVDVIWTISMLEWVKENEKSKWDNISRILFPKDYIRFRFTGSEGTDHVDAQGTLLYDPIKKRWDPELMDIIKIDPGILPEVSEPADIVGNINHETSELTGLKEGIPVVAGTTDTLLEVYAAGSKDNGDCTVKLATFGRICSITDKPFSGKGIVNYSFILPGKWYPGTGTRSCGTSFRWCRDQLFGELDKEVAYSLITDKAEKIQVGSDGLIFHPYLQGEGSPYNDPHLRGDFLGLTLHHTRDHMARAVLEGVAFSLLDSLNFIKENGIYIKPPLRFIGGGSKSKLWSQILSNILGYDSIVPVTTDPSVGAALIAGVGKGIFKNFEQAQEANHGILREISCNNEENKKYQEIFTIYKEAQQKLADIDHKLARRND